MQVLYNLSLDSTNHEFLRRRKASDVLHAAAKLHPDDAMLGYVVQSTTARLG